MTTKNTAPLAMTDNEANERAAFAEWYYANRRKGKSPYEIAVTMHLEHIAALLAAQPSQAQAAVADTENSEADRIIARLSSINHNFGDCIDAVVFIRRLVAAREGLTDDDLWTKFVYQCGASERERVISYSRALLSARTGGDGNG